MTLFEAIIMGIIQGLTEFLPVSSSGHLAIFKQLFNVDLDTGLMFDIMLHVGTLVAIFIVYFKDVVRLIAEGFSILFDSINNVIIFFKNIIKKEDNTYKRIVNNAYRKFVMLIICSTIPTGIIGYVAKDLIEMISGFLIVPGVCLIITAILLFIADRTPSGDKTPKNVSYNNAFVIGICQGIATLPGLSRSGTTITACLLSGFNKKFAVKYSFLMSIPAILGAAVLDLKDIGKVAIAPMEMTYYLIGTVVATIVGFISIKVMLIIVKEKKFKIFSVYCLIVGIVAIIGFFLTI